VDVRVAKSYMGAGVRLRRAGNFKRFQDDERMSAFNSSCSFWLCISKGVIFDYFSRYERNLTGDVLGHAGA
jgi:hypothetical protein